MGTAKLFASEACGRVVDKMVQVHGGDGDSRDVEVERLDRDARVTRIDEGTREVQRLLVSRTLLGTWPPGGAVPGDVRTKAPSPRPGAATVRPP